MDPVRRKILKTGAGASGYEEAGGPARDRCSPFNPIDEFKGDTVVFMRTSATPMAASLPASLESDRPWDSPMTISV